jgi:hypothetical protein
MEEVVPERVVLLVDVGEVPNGEAARHIECPIDGAPIGRARTSRKPSMGTPGTRRAAVIVSSAAGGQACRTLKPGAG